MNGHALVDKLKCSYAERYMGVREPKCGCAACWIKYLDYRFDAVVGLLTSMLDRKTTRKKRQK